MNPPEVYEAKALSALSDAARYDVGPEEWDGLMRLALIHATLASAAATSRASTP